MSIVDIFDTPMGTEEDIFSPELGPEEIANLPTVSGKEYHNGQRKIREVAALRANDNAVSSTWAEFGVERGHSAFFLSHYLPDDGKFFLFDSFEGLPEDWALSDDNIRPGNLWACQPPEFDDPRLIVVPGWFEDTLPHKAMTGPLGLVHIDCDLYSSTKTVLEWIDDQIVPGTVILFDELWGYPNWREGEWRNLMEWHRKFTYLARDTFSRVLIEVI